MTEASRCKPPHVRTLEAACLAQMQAEPWIPVSTIAERIGRKPHHLGPVFARMLKTGRAQRRPGPSVWLWAAGAST